MYAYVVWRVWRDEARDNHTCCVSVRLLPVEHCDANNPGQDVTFQPTESVVVRRRYKYPEASMGNGRLTSVDTNHSDSMAGSRRTRPGQQRDPLSSCRHSPRQRDSDKIIVNKTDDHEGTESQRPPRPRRRRRRRNTMIPAPQQRQSKLEESLTRVHEWLRSCGDIAMEPDTCTWRWHFEQVSQTEATNFDGSIASRPGATSNMTLSPAKPLHVLVCVQPSK